MNESLPTEPHLEVWHVIVHGRPPHAKPGECYEFDGISVETLQLAGNRADQPLPVSFESAYSALEQLELFIEGDGSFCWTAPQAVWRIFGELYDGGAQLHYAELKGYCPAEPWEQILAALGSQQQPLMLQLVRQGVYVTPAAFAQWAWPAA